jgi:hypothetical protein
MENCAIQSAFRALKEGDDAQFWCSFEGPDECRLECVSAMQRIDLDAFLIAGVSIRKAVIRDW